MQLHRDSTIGQLTLSPSLKDGKIVWKDSPLVRAVTEGRALVIDEADKAPLEVVAVLKSLVEDGELLLADGRRILRSCPKEESGKKISCVALRSVFRGFCLFALVSSLLSNCFLPRFHSDPPQLLGMGSSEPPW